MKMDLPFSLVVLALTVVLSTDCCYGLTEAREGNVTTANRSVQYPVVPVEVRLIRDLMERYPPVRHMARPVIDPADPVLVSLRIHLIQIHNFDMKNQILQLMLWKNIEWTDELLTWEPSEYGGVTFITLPTTDIWTPDIILHSHVGRRSVEDHKHVNMVLDHSGSITWIPPVVYTSSCPVDMTYFPFDEQHCVLKFGSWSYAANQLRMVLRGPSDMDTRLFTPSTEWEILEIEAKEINQSYACCKEIFNEIDYVVHFKRKAGFYVKMLLLPALVLSCLVLVIFWIPPQRPDRTGLGMSLFSCFVLLLLVILGSSPHSPSSQLGTYCCCTIILVAIATILSAIMVNVATSKGPMSRVVRQIFVESLAPLLGACASHGAASKVTRDIQIPLQARGEGVSPEVQPGQQPKQTDWAILACVLDRICFIIYMIAIIMCIVFIFPWPHAIHM